MTDPLHEALVKALLIPIETGRNVRELNPAQAEAAANNLLADPGVRAALAALWEQAVERTCDQLLVAVPNWTENPYDEPKGT